MPLITPNGGILGGPQGPQTVDPTKPIEIRIATDGGPVCHNQIQLMTAIMHNHAVTVGLLKTLEEKIKTLEDKLNPVEKTTPDGRGWAKCKGCGGDIYQMPMVEKDKWYHYTVGEVIPCPGAAPVDAT